LKTVKLNSQQYKYAWAIELVDAEIKKEKPRQVGAHLQSLVRSDEKQI